MKGCFVKSSLGGIFAVVFGLSAIQCSPAPSGAPADTAKPAEPVKTVAGAPAGEKAPEAAEFQPSADEPEFAGEMFGTPVPAGNYYFAKRVHSIFQTPEEIKMTPEEKERLIWHNLALSFEAYRRKIEVTPEEFSQWVDSVLAALNLPFTRTKDPEAYRKWCEEELKESVEVFENQMRYLASIEKLKREIVKEMEVTVSEEEIQEDFLNVENHVGGEYQIFATREEAQAFYEAHRQKKKWEKYKKENPDKIKPFHPITLQAIIDLWGVPKDVIYRFHALEEGEVGEPMPFGTQWGVFRLTEKRTGDLNLLPERREQSLKRVESRKKYEAAKKWVDDLYENAQIKVWIKPEPVPEASSSQGGTAAAAEEPAPAS